MDKEDVRRMRNERKKVGNLFLVKNSDTWDFYDFQMKQITYVGFEEVEVYKNCVRVVKTIEGKRLEGLYNNQAKVIMPIKWRKIRLYNNWIECEDVGNKKGIFNYNFQIVLPIRNWKTIIIEYDEVIGVTKFDKKYLYNWNGVCLAEKKDDVYRLNENFIRVKNSSGKYGLINRKADILFPENYSLIELFSDAYGNQYLRAELSETEQGLYNLNLDEIIPCECSIDYRDLVWGREFKVLRKNNEETYFYVKEGVLVPVKAS